MNENGCSIDVFDDKRKEKKNLKIIQHLVSV